MEDAVLGRSELENNCTTNEDGFGQTTMLSDGGDERSHGAIWNGTYWLTPSGCDPPEAQPKRVSAREGVLTDNSCTIPRNKE
ncbi:hypothetical protein JCM9743_33160 [Natrinema sp. JCM 9743]